MITPRFNPEDLRLMCQRVLFLEPGDVAEVRVLGSKGAEYAGYFDNEGDLVREVEKLAKNRTVDALYAVLNQPDPRLIARYHNRMEPRPKTTTTDADILRRRWILVDIDVHRPSGISASDEEREASKVVGRAVRDYLLEKGFESSSLATMTSGNGSYVLVRCDLPNDEESRELVTRFLKALASQFNTDKAHVDQTTFNASRIAALCGTLKGKGDSTDERPHRMVKPSRFPELATPAPVELIRKVAATAPLEIGRQARPAQSTQPSGFSGPFDMERFITENGVQVLDTHDSAGVKRWYITCPFDAGHTGKDAYLLLQSSGAPGFHCSHNSCAGNHWRELIDRTSWQTPRSAESLARAETRRVVTHREAGEVKAKEIERKARATTPERFPQAERERLLKLEKDGDQELEFTEGGNVARMVALYGDRLRSVRAVGWRVWNGSNWESGDALAERCADETVRALYSLTSMLALDASEEQDKAQKSLLSARASRVLEWARRSDKSAMLSAMVKRARFHESLVVDSSAFDLTPWCVAFPNGTWDRGTFRGHEREDYIETLTAVPYHPDTDRSDWLELLGRMTGGDEDFATMLQDVAGYCFSGASSMRIIPWLYGPKGTGKSTFAELLQTALGTCSKPLDWSLLSGQREGERLGSVVRNSRAVFLPEAGKKRLDADILKSLSGSDRLPGRNLFVNETYTVSPTWALIAVSNDPPNMTAYDDALRDRLAALPFVHKLAAGGPLGFTKGEKIESYRRRTDTPLIRGFVAWAVEGLERVYRAQKIHMAKAAFSHTQQFWDDADPLTEFWNQLEDGERRLREGIKAGELRSAYLSWCESEGVRKPLASGTPWGDACRAHGLVKERLSSGPDKGKEVWKLCDGGLFGETSERVNGSRVFLDSSNANYRNVEGVEKKGLPVHPFTNPDEDDLPDPYADTPGGANYRAPEGDF